jgi:glucoamylase
LINWLIASEAPAVCHLHFSAKPAFKANMNKQNNPAPGGPGKFSAWTSGAKTGIGRALNPGSEISFTLGKGVLNEVYFPREDIACIRESGFVITDGAGYFSDERSDADCEERMISAGIPAYLLENRCRQQRYLIQKTILTDPRRNSVLQRVRFRNLQKDSPLMLFLYLTPHMHNQGAENEAWLDEYKGMPMLFAQGGGLALSMACNIGWRHRTVGFIGASEGYGDLRDHRRLTHRYDYAGKGHIQLCAELSIPEDRDSEFLVAIGFGHSPGDAAHQARSSLLDGFTIARDQYVAEWKAWHHGLHARRKTISKTRYLRESAAALRIAESRRYPGGIVASLAIPWGEAREEGNGLGYHLVWPRDLVESAWGFLALNADEDALRILNYLWATQDVGGWWSQNQWLDGQPRKNGLQLDQVALPLLLIDSCYHRGLLDKARWERYLPGVRNAATFLLRNGPFTQQDRWEQQSGLSPFTLATQIAALLAAAHLLEQAGEITRAQLCRDTADTWNEQIEDWTYVCGTAKAQDCGVDGYYVRINPFFTSIDEVKDRTFSLSHRKPTDPPLAIGEVVSVDALALVRFGLRRPNDPRILNTLRVIDAELKKELPAGSCWRRFTGDTYGEDDEGHPFVTTGRGRSWPLLTGERAHYEIAAGNLESALALFRTMEGLSWQGFMPEQVWDEDDIPEKDLYKGRYSGSAMPLTWAQAEYIKLAVSLRQEKIFDMPAHASKRYVKEGHRSSLLVWRFDRPLLGRSGGTRTHLRLELLAAALVRWTADEWETAYERPTEDSGMGIHFADLPIPGGGGRLSFTFHWNDSAHWEGRNFSVDITI